MLFTDCKNISSTLSTRPYPQISQPVATLASSLTASTSATSARASCARRRPAHSLGPTRKRCARCRQTPTWPARPLSAQRPPWTWTPLQRCGRRRGQTAWSWTCAADRRACRSAARCRARRWASVPRRWPRFALAASSFRRCRATDRSTRDRARPARSARRLQCSSDPNPTTAGTRLSTARTSAYGLARLRSCQRSLSPCAYLLLPFWFWMSGLMGE